MHNVPESVHLGNNFLFFHKADKIWARILPMLKVFNQHELPSALEYLDVEAVNITNETFPIQTKEIIDSVYVYEKAQQLGQEQAKTKEAKFSYLRAWPIENESGYLLYHLAKIIKPQLILEGGTSFGVSTLFLAQALQENGIGKVVTVEVSKLKHVQAEENFKRAKLAGYIQQEKLALDQYLKSTDMIYDMIFLDCDRSRYPFYLTQLLPHLRNEALIIVDNALDRAQDIYQYQELIEKDRRFRSALVAIGDGLLLSRFLAV